MHVLVVRYLRYVPISASKLAICLAWPHLLQPWIYGVKFAGPSSLAFVSERANPICVGKHLEGPASPLRGIETTPPIDVHVACGELSFLMLPSLLNAAAQLGGGPKLRRYDQRVNALRMRLHVTAPGCCLLSVGKGYGVLAAVRHQSEQQCKRRHQRAVLRDVRHQCRMKGSIMYLQILKSTSGEK